MPRPKTGYVNAEGKKVPGTTTIINRFKDSSGLIQWAYRCGTDGIDINRAKDEAADAGTCCHEMIDCHLHKREFDRDLWRWGEGVLESADHAFLGYLAWAKNNNLRLVASEQSLVSEKHQFGGTFDVAMIGDAELRLLDFKTSNGIYTDQLIQVAGAYTLLWQEHYGNPRDAVYSGEMTGIDILRISKPDAPNDPISFHHHHWSAEIIPIAQRAFIAMRELYDLDKRLKGML